MSDGVGRRCIIEGLGLELIKENSLVSVTCQFKVAEYFKRALFLRGNEIQTKSGEEEDFCLFLPLLKGRDGRFGDVEEIVGERRSWGPFSPQLRPRLATSSLYNSRDERTKYLPPHKVRFYSPFSWLACISSSSAFSPITSRQHYRGASRTVQGIAAWPRTDSHSATECKQSPFT